MVLSLTCNRFSSLRVNYLTIPVYVFACIILSGFTYVSDKLGKRAAVVMWVPIFVMTGYAIALGTKSAGGGFFAMFLCAGGKIPCPLLMITSADAFKSTPITRFLSLGSQTTSSRTTSEALAFRS